MIVETYDLVGLAEIAERVGVTRQAVGNWRRRFSDFPAAVAELACGPVYLWSQVDEWLDVEHEQVVGAYTRSTGPVAGRRSTLKSHRETRRNHERDVSI